MEPTICAHCGKVIKGKAVRHVPAMFEIVLGTDTIKTFHPSCYKKAQPDGAQPQ